jgi:uncharacterized protein YndB with AHSA1/START domain
MTTPKVPSSESVRNVTLVAERAFDASPGSVFAAWADPVARARWAAGPDDWRNEFTIEFAIGGQEVYRGGPESGPEHAYTATYLDIEPNRRIVYAYDMRVGRQRLSVSLVTVEFSPDGPHTRVKLTEQAAFLDGLGDPATLERHNHGLLAALDAELRRGVGRR